jgi:hypothetical protein
MMAATWEKAVEAGVPTILWGVPGVGKSSAVRAFAKARNLHCEVVIASIREPSDFLGLPVAAGEGVRFVPPQWAVNLHRLGEGVLFLDEISTAPPAVQAALLRVVLERTVGELTLPEGVRIVAAANPPETAAGGWELSPALANRFLHFEYQISPLDWADSFVSYWGDPPTLRSISPEEWMKARALVAGFIRSRPQLLIQVPEEPSAAGRAWPSPRTWDAVSRLFAAVGDDIETFAPLAAGAVGSGAAIEFVAWLKEGDLPDPEKVIADPRAYVVPPRGDRAYAVLAAVAEAVASNTTAARWKAAWKVIAKTCEAGMPDVAAFAARRLAKMARQNLPLPVEEVQVLAPILKEVL